MSAFKVVLFLSAIGVIGSLLGRDETDLTPSVPYQESSLLLKVDKTAKTFINISNNNKDQSAALTDPELLQLIKDGCNDLKLEDLNVTKTVSNDHNELLKHAIGICANIGDAAKTNTLTYSTLRDASVNLDNKLEPLIRARRLEAQAAEEEKKKQALESVARMSEWKPIEK